MSKYIDAFFDTVAFIDAIDQVRQERKVSWAHIEKVTGVTYVNLHRIRRVGGANMSVRILAALVLWSGIDPRPFMKDRSRQEVTT